MSTIQRAKTIQQIFDLCILLGTLINMHFLKMDDSRQPNKSFLHEQSKEQLPKKKAVVYGAGSAVNKHLSSYYNFNPFIPILILSFQHRNTFISVPFKSFPTYPLIPINPILI